jgi:hypothetical protein
MAPNNPCKRCKQAGRCCMQGLVNRLAMWEWLEDRNFECADHDPDHHHGIEGVFA